MHHRDTTRYGNGLTVLELMIALAVLSVVAGLGVPALRDFSLNAQRVAAVNGLLGAIQFARSAALTRAAPVVLCQTADTQNCSGASDRGMRWMVAVDAAPDTAAIEPNPQVVRIIELRFAGSVVSNRAAFEFRPFPLRSTNGTISFCDVRGSQAQRAIVVSYSGRPRVTAAASEQGFPACPRH